MKVNLKKFRIEKTASRDDTGTSLNCVYLDVDHSVLVATDGFGMAVIPVTELGLDDESGLIPAEAIQLARRDQQKRPDAEMSANGNVGVSLRGKLVEFTRVDAEFPTWTELMAMDGRPVASMVLSPTTLAQVANAIGCGLVRLDVYRGGKAKVSPIEWDYDIPAPSGLIVTRDLKTEAAAA